MKNCSKCKIDKELSEFHKRASNKDGRTTVCKVCRKIETSKYYQKHKVKIIETVRKYREVNPEKIKEINKKSYVKNAATVKASSREYYHNNQPAMRQAQSEYYAEHKDRLNARAKARYEEYYYKENKADYAQRTAKRRAAILQRTPKWLTADDWKWIAWHYKHARVMGDMYGEPYQVDHTIPLQGELVSGLHTPLNLQVITRSENASKGNKFTP